MPIVVPRKPVLANGEVQSGLRMEIACWFNPHQSVQPHVGARASANNSIDRSFIGTHILNIDQGTVYVNKAFMDIFGYKNIEEVKTGPPHTHFTTESYAKWALRHELMQGIPYPDNYEADIIRKDGAIRHLQVYRQDVFWDGKMRYQVLYRDITERKQAEDAPKESESRFHELYENSPIGLYRTTPSGRILMANPALIEMLKQHA